MASRLWLAADAPGVGRWILHTRKLLGRGRTALATIVTRAAFDPDARVNRVDLILTLFNSLVCADALVLVWLHQTSHSHYFSANNDAAIRRVCVGLLPRV